ncbi:putative eukaryotic translation initiation factor 3 subunit E [Helianthus anomalus]
MAMAKYDFTPLITLNHDRQLVFSLLDFTQEHQLYPNNTNLVDYDMDLDKSLYHTKDVPRGYISIFI